MRLTASGEPALKRALGLYLRGGGILEQGEAGGAKDACILLEGRRAGAKVREGIGGAAGFRIAFFQKGFLAQKC